MRPDPLIRAREKISEAKEENPIVFFEKYNKYIHFTKFDPVFAAYLLLCYGEYNEDNYSRTVSELRKKRLPQMTRRTVEEWVDCSYIRERERWSYFVELLHSHVSMEYELLYKFMD